VSGLAAKTILDTAAAIADADVIPQLIPQLEQVGYHYRGAAGDSSGHLLVRESAPTDLHFW